MAKPIDEISRAYSSPTWWYDVRGFFILTLSYQDTLWGLVSFFVRNLSGRHLEAAVGSGSFLSIVLRLRRLLGYPEARGEAFDYAPRMLAGARRAFSKDTRWNFRVEDAARLPYADASFDTVNVANALHCFPEVDAAIGELYRVLSPGGTLAANVLTFAHGRRLRARVARRIERWGIRRGILFTPYEPADIRSRFERAGFRLVKERRRGNDYCLLLSKPKDERQGPWA